MRCASDYQGAESQQPSGFPIGRNVQLLNKEWAWLSILQCSAYWAAQPGGQCCDRSVERRRRSFVDSERLDGGEDLLLVSGEGHAHSEQVAVETEAQVRVYIHTHACKCIHIYVHVHIYRDSYSVLS